MTVRIYRHENALSDGSLVYSVSIGPSDGESRPLVLDAVTETDADQLIWKIRHAISEHTNIEPIEVVYLSEANRLNEIARSVAHQNRRGFVERPGRRIAEA